MRWGLKDATIQRIQSVLAHYPQVEQAVLYGSRAKGNHKNGSDIDLTLCGGADLTLNVLYKIMGDLDDLLLPYTIDLSIFHGISDPDVVEHIQRVGITFYERNRNGGKMNLLDLIRDVEIFRGLNENELEEIVAICQSKELEAGEDLVTEGDVGEEFYLITSGAVEVVLGAGLPSPRTVLHMGAGQLIGEMALIDLGRRSATVRAGEGPTNVQVIRNDDFLELCERNTHVGYAVMRNMAADLSFKLRHLNLIKSA